MVKRNIKKPVYIPDKCDLVWINFNPVIGHEQKGRRPGLVLTGLENNRITGMALICPVTSRVKGHAFEVPLVGSRTQGVVLSNQIRSIDVYSRTIEFIEKVPPHVVAQVAGHICALIEQ